MEIAGTSVPPSSLEAASDLRDQTGLTILFFHVAGLADASPGIGGSTPVRGCIRVRSSWPKISVLSQRDTYARRANVHHVLRGSTRRPLVASILWSRSGPERTEAPILGARPLAMIHYQSNVQPSFEGSPWGFRTG